MNQQAVNVLTSSGRESYTAPSGTLVNWTQGEIDFTGTATDSYQDSSGGTMLSISGDVRDSLSMAAAPASAAAPPAATASVAALQTPPS